MSDDNVVNIKEAAGRMKPGRPNPAFREDWPAVLADANARREKASAARDALTGSAPSAELRRRRADLAAEWEHNHQLGMRCHFDYKFRTFEDALASVTETANRGNAYDPVFIADVYEFSDVRQLIMTASTLYRARISLEAEKAVVPKSISIENEWAGWLDDMADASNVSRSVLVRRILGAFLASPLAADLGEGDRPAKPSVRRQLAVQVSEETNAALEACALSNGVSVATIMSAALLAERRGHLTAYHKTPPILVTPDAIDPRTGKVARSNGEAGG